MSKLTNKLLALSLLAVGFISAQEVEPTTPEKTEFYEPVPPKVTPGEDGAPRVMPLYFLMEHRWTNGSVLWTAQPPNGF